MCGRYSLHTHPEVIALYFKLGLLSELETLFVLGQLGSRVAARLKKVGLTMGLPELHGHVLDTSSLSP